jgi:hypothetical protein
MLGVVFDGAVKIVYVLFNTPDVFPDESTANAFRLQDAVSVIGLLYTWLLVVGVVPSRV